jgi:hypothetical protein
MMTDNTMTAVWKINGVCRILEALQTSEDCAGHSESDLYFVLANELEEALELLRDCEE